MSVLNLNVAAPDDPAAGASEPEGQAPSVLELQGESIGTGKDEGLGDAGDVDVPVALDRSTRSRYALRVGGADARPASR